MSLVDHIPTKTVTTALAGAVTLPTRAIQQILSPPAIIAARKRIRDLKPPSHWDVDNYTVNGIDVPRYISEAKDPVVEFHFCTGFNSSPLVYAPVIDVMNKMGISVFATKLLQSGELDTDSPKDLIKFHLDSTRRFFTASRIRHNNKDIPKIAGTHSAAGGYLAEHTSNTLPLSQITRNFNGGALHIAPFFDIANASRRFHPKKHAIFMKYARENPHLLPSDTLRGQAVSAYNRMKGQPQIFSADREPTYGEVLALRSIGDSTIEAHQKLPWQPTLKQHFVIATHDKASCSETAKLFADLQGASITELDAYHNPVLQSFKNVERLANRLLKMGESADVETGTSPVTEYKRPKAYAAATSPVRAPQAT